MRTGEALALVKPTATVMDAALAMTASHGGSALVVDKAGKLKGIFTDGDFRRVMATGGGAPRLAAPAGGFAGGYVPAPREGETPSPQILSTAVGKVMTAKPSFVYADDYAVDLLKIFARKRIDDLPVCDRKGRVVGIVDIQDLPKMKVL